MLAGILIAAGTVVMLFGVVMLAGWVGGKGRWFGVDVYDRTGVSKTDRQFLNLYFMAIVLAPLFFGGMLIVFGLRALGTP